MLFRTDLQFIPMTTDYFIVGNVILDQHCENDFPPPPPPPSYRYAIQRNEKVNQISLSLSLCGDD